MSRKVFSAERTRPQPFVATEREQKLMGPLTVGWIVLFFAASLLSNLLHRWWPVLIFGAAGVVMILAMTAWSARTRGQTWHATFIQILRTKQEPRGTWRERLRRRLQDP